MSRAVRDMGIHSHSCSHITDSGLSKLYDLSVPNALHRFYGNGDLHFVTCSCYQRLPLLGSPHRRDMFLMVLERVRRCYRLVVLGYVVMPEHFHLLMREPQRGTLSTVMQALKMGFTRRVIAEAYRRGDSDLPPMSRKSRDMGHPIDSYQFWQPRFYDFNVWTERKRIEKLRYIHNNPVKRGLVKEPNKWAWSSFRSCFCGEPGIVRINDCDVFRLRVNGDVA